MSCEFCLGYIKTEGTEEDLQESDLFLDCGDISDDCPCKTCESECAMMCEKEDCKFWQEFFDEEAEIIEKPILVEIDKDLMKCTMCNTIWKKESGNWREHIIN